MWKKQEWQYTYIYTRKARFSITFKNTVCIARRIRNRPELCSLVAPIFGGLYGTGSRMPEMNVTRIKVLSPLVTDGMRAKRSKKISRSIEDLLRVKNSDNCIISCMLFIILYLYLYHSIYLANRRFSKKI